ncbi:MAG: SIMPL domain-containing protein [Gemmatimonadaceae bacterium]
MLRPLIVASIVSLAPALAAQDPSAGSAAWARVPQIVTSAQGESRVTPDRATIVIGVETRAPTAAQASAENARRQRAVIDTVRALGITPDQYSTTGYNVAPERVYPPNGGQSKITGYVVTNMIRVEVRRIEQVGAILDAALAKGANGVNSLQFTASGADSARHLAIAAAVLRARADADAMARAAGGRLGDLLELDLQGGAPSPQPMMMARAQTSAEGGTPINPGEQTIVVAIVARWQYLGAAK